MLAGNTLAGVSIC